MESKPETTERNRQKRVKQLKKIILTAVFVMLMVPTILCVICMVNMSAMQKQLDAAMVSLNAVFSEYTETAQEIVISQQDILTDAEPIVSQNEIEASVLTSEDPYEGMVKICLTFDDGPSGNTDEILDILADYGIQATFFVNGKEGYDSQYIRIVEEGHTIGMHSYSHSYRDIYRDLDSFAADLYEIQALIQDITGVTSTYYRFPGGSSNQVSNVDMVRCIEYLNAKGISYYDWNVSSQDAVVGGSSVNSIVNAVMQQMEAQTSDTIIILFHDSADKTSTVEALPIIIEKIAAMENTVFLPISDEIEPVRHVVAE